jgi:predicted Zn-dependent peptidase
MSASRFLKTLTAAGLLLATASGASAQQAPATAKATPPPPAPAKEVKFPQFQEKTLSNGLRVVVIEQHEQPAVSLRLLLPTAGTTFEPEGKAGVAEATAALLTKGTATRSSQQIAEAIDFVGGGLFASASLESGNVTASVTADQLDLGFDLMADVVLRPSFPQDEIDRWRRQALSGLQVQYQNAGYLAGVALARVLYGDHPYGRPDDGTPQSLQSLTRDDLAGFHKRTYIPNSALLAVVGDVKAADAFARAEKAFGGWQKADPPRFPTVQAKASEGHRILVIDKPDAVQTEIRLGQIGLPYRDPNHFAAQVYNAAVGANASARLFDEIRRKRGLSYGAYSDFTMPTQPGWYEVSTNTKTETTVEALDVALEVLSNVPKQPIPQQELTAAKTYMTGAFPLMIETPEGIAEQVLDAMRHGYGRDWLEGYNNRISQVTAADVQKFAQERIHPDKMAIVLVGNASTFSEALKKKYGAFETIPAAELDFLQANLRKAKTEQPAASAADQARGMEIVRKVQQALGGAAFTGQKTQIVKGTGTLSPPGAPQPMQITSLTTYSMMPDKDRTELTLPMGSMVQVQSGAQSWMSFGPQVQDTSAQAGEQRFYGYDVLRRAGQEGYTARPLPDAQVDGKTVKAVEVADAQGHATRFFIDPATNLVVKLEYTSGGESPEIFLSDYRDVSGVKVPFKTRILQQGQQLMEMTYTEVQVNAPLDDKLFQKPQG